MDRHINVPMTKEDTLSLKAGDYVYLTGTIYTARDAAHKRMDETLDKGGMLPFDIKNNIIYYMGPSPAREGRPIGCHYPQPVRVFCGRGRSRSHFVKMHPFLGNHCI